MTRINSKFWHGKKVFITGHTGFKGSWLSFWLASMGAKVTGYGLAPNTTPSLFTELDIESLIERSHIANIQDASDLQKAMFAAEPDIVIHMAAQPLVRYSYDNPVETYATNVMGTVHVLESVRTLKSVRVTLVITTDKCYENKEWVWGYREIDPVGGYDPYSSSKACAELVTASYRQSFFNGKESFNHLNAVASARAGNVIGGGDWSPDRLIPDAIRSFRSGKSLKIRNPLSTRPWQHVLDALMGYLILAERLFDDSKLAGPYNFGPGPGGDSSVKYVVNLMGEIFENLDIIYCEGGHGSHEANLLSLDISKSIRLLGYQPKWGLEDAFIKSANWYKSFYMGINARRLCEKDIEIYIN